MFFIGLSSASIYGTLFVFHLILISTGSSSKIKKNSFKSWAVKPDEQCFSLHWNYSSKVLLIHIPQNKRPEDINSSSVLWIQTVCGSNIKKLVVGVVTFESQFRIIYKAGF
ncbi:MAG: hypothetical protein CVV24_13255 [Ignavibacteriae bacterium HGW-Ignavibacteriae-3]|nr:MAG: hypothetical protein CVV24_13255 [Ignavibacteriae bacterium HGW-Ignavibacteriae-3]